MFLVYSDFVLLEKICQFSHNILMCVPEILKTDGFSDFLYSVLFVGD